MEEIENECKDYLNQKVHPVSNDSHNNLTNSSLRSL